MTGKAFLDALGTHIAPRTVASINGSSEAITIKLSDGNSFDVKRKNIRAADTWDDLPADVRGV